MFDNMTHEEIQEMFNLVKAEITAKEFEIFWSHIEPLSGIPKVNMKFSIMSYPRKIST